MNQSREDIDRVRRQYYEDLASGRAKVPEQQLGTEPVSIPSPKQKKLLEQQAAKAATMEFNAHGGPAVPEQEQGQPREAPDAGTVTRGALVETDDAPAAPGAAPEAPPIDHNDLDTDDESEDEGVVAIPDNFAQMPWNDIRTLAKRFTPNPVKNRDDAIAVIQAELDSRSA